MRREELRDFQFKKHGFFLSPDLFSEASSHNDAHDTRYTMSSTATLGVETRMRKREHDASAANAGEAIPGLLNDIVVTHVLRSENVRDDDVVESAGDSFARVSIAALALSLARASFHTERRGGRHRRGWRVRMVVCGASET